MYKYTLLYISECRVNHDCKNNLLDYMLLIIKRERLK